MFRSPLLAAAVVIMAACGGGDDEPATTLDPIVDGMVDPPAVDDADVEAAVDTMQVRLNDIADAEASIRATCHSLESFAGAVGVTSTPDDWTSSELRDALLVACPAHVAYGDEVHALSD